MVRKLILSLALLVGATLPILDSARAAVGDGVVGGQRPSVRVAPVEKAQYVYGRRHYCWSLDGWRGPGWYRCGYAYRHGYGWGGGEGWNGWRGGEGEGWRGGGGWRDADGWRDGYGWQGGEGEGWRDGERWRGGEGWGGGAGWRDGGGWGGERRDD
jgi:hypothetical protein